MSDRSVIARQPAGEIDLIRNLDDVSRIATFVAQSKLFGCQNAAEAAVKIIAGREMGFGAIQSMASIHIIDGKPSPGADLIAAAIRRPGSGYDYECETSDKFCKVKIYRLVNSQKKLEGSLHYTIEEAVRKGWNKTQKGQPKSTWDQKPANMLFARAITDAKRFFCPDVMTSIFDADEIDSPSFAAPVVAQEPIPMTLPVDPERPTDLTINDDGSLRSPADELREIRSGIESLASETGVTNEMLAKRLNALAGIDTIYQTEDLILLKQIRGELMVRKAKKGGAA